jgi:hypothetical protein
MLIAKDPDTTIIIPIATRLRDCSNADALLFSSTGYGNKFIQMQLSQISHMSCRKHKTFGKFAFPDGVENPSLKDFAEVTLARPMSQMRINEAWTHQVKKLNEIVDVRDFRDILFNISYDYGEGWKRYRVLTYQSHSGHDYNGYVIKFDHVLDAIQFKLSL